MTPKEAAQQLHENLFSDHEGKSYLDEPTTGGEGFYCDLFARDAEAIAVLVRQALAGDA